MSSSLNGRSVLLVVAAIIAQAAHAQATVSEPVAANEEPADAQAAPAEGAEPVAEEEIVDVELPGAEIVITGRRERDITRSTSQVVSVLSSADIARTGEGDIAGALGRVTGLSVVGNGFVYVRGLGDRYSQSLLNGLPLPSPEPLKRAVPLDLFPTDVIASSLVQKTYSPNFPGEFGGGVINLTTLAIPRTPFFKVSVGGSGDTETTGQLGYDHRGGAEDWTGYDNGRRDLPPALRSFLASGKRMSSGEVNTGAILKQLVNTDTALVQQIGSMPGNYSGSVSGGTSWMIGESQLGLVATAGSSNEWRVRDIIQQSPGNADLSLKDADYRNVVTEDHIVNNALLGLAYEFGDANRIRWTNLYIHDTLKRTSLAEGKENNQRAGQDFLEQGTGWYERELLNTQLNVGLKFDPVSVDFRAAYARSKREAPFEMNFGYQRTNAAADPYGAYFLNRLDNGQGGFADIAFSDLDETLKSAGLDLSGSVGERTVITAGLDYSDTRRNSQRRVFQIVAPSTLPKAVSLLRPDYLLGAAPIEYFGIGMVETTETDPAFEAGLKVQAGYLQLQTEFAEGLEINAGARYEDAEQEVLPVQVFDTLTNSGASTRLENQYVLPAATLTWRIDDAHQLRFNASKTIARPQFRELMFQAYFDPETNRSYRGNPLLVDTEFVNAEARYEWYFQPEQRLSLAGFYKQIDKPVEAFTGFNDNTPVTSYANAPKASLYGIEADVQKYFPLEAVSGSAFLSSRRVVAIANYTFTQSELKVGAGDTVAVFGTAVQPASNFFEDGSPLTGQSDHLVNLQLGLEGLDRMSQQTLLLSYASDRVTSRGAAGLPDIMESPGIRLDFVMREGFELFGKEMELKLELRNLTRREYREFQQRGSNKVYYNRYDVGTKYSLSLSTSF
ncbi:MAG: hypothetical protein RL026_1616 [Pseudomonadota bacterium]